MEWFLLELGFGFKIPLNQILMVLPYEMNVTQQLYRRFIATDKLFRATKGRQARSLIILKEGIAFTSARTPDEVADSIYELKLLERAKLHGVGS